MNEIPVNNILAEWENFISKNCDYYKETASSHKPVIDLSRSVIYRKYKEILESGDKIDDNSEHSELHGLRIKCKNLRYLMEFFASLYPEKNIKKLIRQLKQLQDYLGEFNDLSVQQSQLKTYRETGFADSGLFRTSEAIDSLLIALSKKQTELRAEFSDKFKTFQSSGAKSLFIKLFQTEN